MAVQQVHLAGRKLGGEQDGPAGPGVVLVDDVPDDQAFLVRLDHHLRGDVLDVSYLHGSPHFLYPRRIGEKTPRSGNIFDTPILRIRTLPRSAAQPMTSSTLPATSPLSTRA